MRLSRFRSIAVVTVLTATVASVALGQQAANALKALDPSDPSLPQIWIALGHRLDVEKVKVGDEFPGLTLEFFAFRTCAIQKGYVLHGRVVAVHPWSESSRQASIDLQFSTQCLDGTLLPLTLIAAYDPLPKGGSQTDIMTALPMNINPSYSNHMDPKYPNLPPSNDASFPVPVATPGEVHRIPHLSILVAKGEQGSTQMRGDLKRFRIEEGTRLGMVPAQIPAKPER